MSDRLTDGAWQEILANGENPPHPCWFSSFHSGDYENPDYSHLSIVGNIATNDTYLQIDNTLTVFLNFKNMLKIDLLGKTY